MDSGCFPEKHRAPCWISTGIQWSPINGFNFNFKAFIWGILKEEGYILLLDVSYISKEEHFNTIESTIKSH